MYVVLGEKDRYYSTNDTNKKRDEGVTPFFVHGLNSSFFYEFLSERSGQSNHGVVENERFVGRQVINSWWI
ncbi:hypothetical protein PcaKH15_01980 [Parageobacillus caldoxylosilyticus]|uniref:Uncharacterized protein n=1 Tax=Parageobacillus caldoxylosilyticus NBRC 107762 TaxID=1220594 RepID=A0A023DFU4_9BACL|nr:hypothetical protein PcaKH15_01980 [Parageobacillus caldoxylosilyticus]BDG38061.1 hypothetical protein PcaKH16_02000 [Parageobacillus caldoxylosilyticus]BDG41840.1 hypothetical protein PcaKH35_01850 [Parageobacillus caldoxylosilyticus]GAJ39881.1 hypothetical protein GCA01S_029_00600 [Parageobacillus caldoxylosilyticus NBRC 107762]